VAAPTQIEHLGREFYYGLRRSLRSHLAPVILMAVALFVLGLFLLSTRNLQHVIRLAQEKVGVTVYLEENTGEETRTHLTDLLGRLGGVRRVDYISEAEAVERFRETLGGRAYLLDGVEGDPLPASFELDLYDDWKTLERIETLVAEIHDAPGVESIVYGEDWVEKLERWIYFFVAVDLFLGIVLGLATLLVVGNTMKLAMADRRDTINVLRLVGATRTQIRLPYTLEGAFLGALAACLALLLLAESYRFAAERLPGVLFLGTAGLVVFVILGAVLGAGGSLLSLHRYMRVRRS